MGEKKKEYSYVKVSLNNIFADVTPFSARVQISLIDVGGMWLCALITDLSLKALHCMIRCGGRMFSHGLLYVLAEVL